MLSKLFLVGAVVASIALPVGVAVATHAVDTPATQEVGADVAVADVVAEPAVADLPEGVSVGDDADPSTADGAGYGIGPRDGTGPIHEGPQDGTGNQFGRNATGGGHGGNGRAGGGGAGVHDGTGNGYGPGGRWAADSDA